MADSKISNLTGYTPAVDTDVLPIVDTTTATTKKITWANLKATLKTYFDTLYAAALGANDNYVTDAEKVVIGNTSGTNTGDNAANSNYASDYRPGGTDVAIADGGTGASTALMAMTALAFQSRARAYRATSNQTLTDLTETKVQLNAETFDGLNEFDSTTNYRFTASSAGYYQVIGSIRMQLSTAGKLVQVLIKVDGATVSGAQHYTVTTSDDIIVQASDIIYLAANSYVELWALHNKGSNADIITDSARVFLSIHRLS